MLSGKKKHLLILFIIICLAALPVHLKAQVTEAWVKRYDGPAHVYDFARKLAVDDLGNVFVTGRSGGIRTSEDFATIKYDSVGNELWISRYAGPADSIDTGIGLFIDYSANAYVSGSSTGTDVFDDYLSVKYDSDGTEHWVQRYNGPLNNVDTPYDMTGDILSNVYVTGFSVGTTSFKDCTTIKYDTDGTELWVARYNGPFNRNDEARAIFLDNMGNVYISGLSFNGSMMGKDDCLTIKYDNNGNEIWTANYNGPGNDDDIANDIVVDNLGNVYISGSCTGTSSGTDYLTIKYDSSGTEQWVAFYDSPSYSDDKIRAMVTDDSGNVYVTGSSGSGIATIKYDTYGNELWATRVVYGKSDAHAISIDFEGNIYVAGFTEPVSGWDLAVFKYDSDGTLLWYYQYDGPDHGSDLANDIFIDSNLSVYVTGGSDSALTNRDYVTIKLLQTKEIYLFSNDNSRTFFLILISVIIFYSIINSRFEISL